VSGLRAAADGHNGAPKHVEQGIRSAMKTHLLHLVGILFPHIIDDARSKPHHIPKVSKLMASISWRIASLSCSILRGVFLYTLFFNRPQRKKSAGVRSGDLGGQRFF
jgi:hypothetical protein